MRSPLDSTLSWWLAGPVLDRVLALCRRGRRARGRPPAAAAGATPGAGTPRYLGADELDPGRRCPLTERSVNG
jgi:hypothetical protein